MGCKCKEQASNIQKYTDDEVFEKTNWFESIIVFILRNLVFILSFIIILIIMPFFLIYLFINTLLGKETNINLKKLFRKNIGKNE